MLGFVTSLRARALARDWSRHVWMLERTIDSMLAGPDTEVIVVCHDPPELRRTDPRVTVLSLDMPIPARNNDAMCVDKVVKLSAGIAALQSRRVDYIGLCDADDLVSRRLSTFVREHAGAAGWFAPIMYTYAYGGRWMRRRPMPEMEAGPFAVVRADLLELVSPPFSGWWVDEARAAGDGHYVDGLASHARPVCPMVAAGHTRYCSVLARDGHLLQPLPFTAHLMVNHDDSTSTVDGGRGAAPLPTLAQIARGVHRWLPTLRPLTANMRRDFAIPDMIPTQYESGSVLWR